MSKDQYILLKSLFFILFYQSVIGQEFSSFKPEQFTYDSNYGSFNYVQLFYYNGAHVNYKSELENVFQEGYSAFEARLGWQSTGRQFWQRIHRFPVYGLGVFTGSIAKIPTTLGSIPIGLYFFYGEPIFRFRKNSLLIDLALGLAYDRNQYNTGNKTLNDVLGSKINLYSNFNLVLTHELTERFDLSFGINFFHFSNGRTNSPQHGINMNGFNLAAKYNFNAISNYKSHIDPNYKPQIRPEFVKKPIPKVIRKGEIQFSYAAGSVETNPGELKTRNGNIDTNSIQKRYFTSTISIDYAYLILHRLKLHAGLDGFYDGSIENYINGHAPQNTYFDDKVLLGADAGFQYLIERFTVFYSFGAYIYKETNQRGIWYMRAGGRIGLTEDIDAHIAIKTRDGGVADWIEWGIVFKLKI